MSEKTESKLRNLFKEESEFDNELIDLIVELIILIVRIWKKIRN